METAHNNPEEKSAASAPAETVSPSGPGVTGCTTASHYYNPPVSSRNRVISHGPCRSNDCSGERMIRRDTSGRKYAASVLLVKALGDWMPE